MAREVFRLVAAWETQRLPFYFLFFVLFLERGLAAAGVELVLQETCV